MDVFEAIQQRYSVRSYKGPVEDDKLVRVLNAGILSPSGRNAQHRKFVVVRDARIISELAIAAGQDFIAKAPVVIAVVATAPEIIMKCKVPAGPVDCAVAIDHMTLAAVAEGLGTCWIGHFDQDACKKVLKVPENAQIVELLTLGYPVDKPRAKSRKQFEEVVCFEQYS